MATNKRNEQYEITTDFIIGLGQACRPAHYLRVNKLRRCSNPLDWMMSYSLDTVINLFKNDFNNFFVSKEEIIEMTNAKFRCIQDTQNKITSVHSFPTDKKIDVAYESFSKTMAHRYNRMKKCMSSSEHILFVSNRNEPLENFEKFLLEINKLFKCKCTFLNIRYDNENIKTKAKICPELEIIEYSFNDVHPNGSTIENPDFWLGNADEWNKVMQTITLTNKFAYMDENFIVMEDRAQK